MRGKFYSDATTVNTMEAAICDIQAAVDEVADLPMTAEMSKLLGQIEATIKQLHKLNEDRIEPQRPADDRAAQAMGWPERY